MDRYTASERACFHHIDNLEADSDVVDNINNKNDNEGEEEEKDERYYLREERALKWVEVITKLRLHIEEAWSMCHLARTTVVQANEDTQNNVPIEQMHLVAIVDFCQNV